METHAVTERAPRTMLRRSRSPSPAVLTWTNWLLVGSASGLLAGVLMAIPLIVWDWSSSAHIALELPTATTAWLFGLNHFSHGTYRVGPIVLGVASLCVYWILSGLAFAGLADRAFRIRTLGESIAAGAVWSFVSFIFFWYMLLPIARDGAPYRATTAFPDLFVAPNWVWILSFTVFGLATGAFYAALTSSARTAEVETGGNGRG